MARSGQAIKTFRLSKLELDGKVYKNVTLSPLRASGSKRRYAVLDSRGRVLLAPSGDVATLSRRRQQSLVAAEQEGTAPVSLERRAQRRASERGAVLAAEIARGLRGEQTTADGVVDLARRWRGQRAYREGIHYDHLDDVLDDPLFREDMGRIYQKRGRRKFTPKSKLSKSLIRFGYRDEQDDFYVGNSPRGTSEDYSGYV